MNPQRTLRKWMYLSHLWIGLILGLYFALLGLTGSTLVFKNEILAAVHPQFHHVDVPANAKRASLDAIAQTFKDATPGAKISTLILPAKQDEPIIIAYHSIQPNTPGGKRHDWRQTFVNPYTGTIIGDEIGGSEFFHTVRNLHARLLLEDTGIDLNRYGVLFIITLLLSGIYIWFPSAKSFLLQFLQRTTIRFNASFNRVVYDIHNAFGFYSSCALLVLATTAVSSLWYDQANAVVCTLTNTPFFSKKDLPALEKDLNFSYDQLYASTVNAVPGYAPAMISDRMMVLMQPPDNHYLFPRIVSVSMDYETGTISKIDRPENKPLGMQIMNWTMPVHYGQWGYGSMYYPVKALWVLIGLCPSILCISGFLMYFNKQNALKLADKKREEMQSKWKPASDVKSTASKS